MVVADDFTGSIWDQGYHHIYIVVDQPLVTSLLVNGITMRRVIWALVALCVEKQVAIGASITVVMIWLFSCVYLTNYLINLYMGVYVSANCF